MKHFYVLLLIAALLSSCQKETVATAPDFSAHTVTDESGVITGVTDSTDWTYDDTWTQQEFALVSFKGTDTLATTDTLTGSIEVHPLFPNPCDSSFTLSATAEYPCKMKLAFVNADMEMLQYKFAILATGKNNFAFNFQSLTAFKNNENYRVYYAFCNFKDSIFYKGHGDFRIERP